MNGNKRKHWSYKEAWHRIKQASTGGFHFEVVTLCESIISDRLLSYLRRPGSNSRANTHTPFAHLISEWRKTAPSLPTIDGVDIGKAVDDWRKNRNNVIHGLTKSNPGTPTEDVGTFLDRAQNTASAGIKLAKAVSNWHKQEKRSKKAGEG